MVNEIRSLCVFCGSSMGASHRYAEAAKAMGREIGRRGLRLVYGGGDIGLMGVLAVEASRSGAEVVGVIPRKLHELVDQPELSELVITKDMHERKAKMADLADAFVALPGGIGTFEELFEVWTWRQIGYHRKPLGLLDVEGYWSPLLALLAHAVEEGFVRRAQLDDLPVETDPSRLLDALADLPPPSMSKLPPR
jgi:uncharacterized protein (TIGR00730 family)